MLTEISVHVITCICDTSVPLYVHVSPKISTIKYERFFTCLDPMQTLLGHRHTFLPHERLLNRSQRTFGFWKFTLDPEKSCLRPLQEDGVCVLGV